MAAPVPKAQWQQFFRAQFEATYAGTVGTDDWNIGGNGGGVNGFRDLAVIPGTVRINPTETQIFLENAAGKRALNQQAPVPGGYAVEGSFEMPFVPELIYPIFRAVMGGVSNVETAGSAALASTAFASVATLDTQPDGTEVLKFVISSSTAAAGAAINIIQSTVTVETITIGTSGSTVDGDYYSKGAYDGSSNAITFTVDGTVTAGTVVVSGVDYVTNTFTMATTNPSMKLEEAGQPKSASNSGFYTGAAFKDFELTFDKTALDGLIMVTTNFASQFYAAATATTYDNDVATYYHPFAGWNVTITKGGAAFDKVQQLTLNVDGGTELFMVASGDQNPAGMMFGPQQVVPTFTILPEDATEWNAFVGQTVADYHIVLTSPNNIVDSTKWSTTIELTKSYIETYAENSVDTQFGAEMAMRTIEDSSDGIIKITHVSRMPV
jgi:hypothetical protein